MTSLHAYELAMFEINKVLDIMNTHGMKASFLKPVDETLRQQGFCT